MGRTAARNSKSVAIRNLPTSTAREMLPTLVNEMVAITEPGESLTECAVEIGPRNKGGAMLLPTVAVRDAERRIEELEDEIEDMAIAMMLQSRLATSSGKTISADDFLRDLGFDDLLA